MKATASNYRNRKGSKEGNKGNAGKTDSKGRTPRKTGRAPVKLDRSDVSDKPDPKTKRQQQTQPLTSHPGPSSPPRRALIGITLGDPAGVGPEVTLKALLGKGEGSGDALLCEMDVLLIGPAWVYREVAGRFALRARFEEIDRDAFDSAPDRASCLPAAERKSGCVPVFPVYTPRGCEEEFILPYGREDALCGALAIRAIEAGARLAMAGRVDAIVTAPISKAALNAAGAHFPGHTEMLQSLARSPRVGMMLAGGGLRVALVTIHEAMARVPELLTTERVFEMIRLTHEFLRSWDCPEPRLALCAFNPHAGEGGMFGDEEMRVLIPAARQARENGMRVEGPLPADTVFHFARQGQFDAVVSLYHDQALIPIKTLDFDGGVNLTMGLPFVRTSPDHGTAFGIAGQGVARATSMRHALRTACDLARRRRNARAGDDLLTPKKNPRR